MHITTAFIIRLVKMPDAERNQFLFLHRQTIDFTLLSARVKQMADASIERTETELAEKFLDIKADIALFEAVQRFPAAVKEFELVASPSQDKKVVMEMSCMQ